MDTSDANSVGKPLPETASPASASLDLESSQEALQTLQTDTASPTRQVNSWTERLVAGLGWLIAIGMVALTVYLWQSGMNIRLTEPVMPTVEPTTAVLVVQERPIVQLSASDDRGERTAIHRLANLHTIFPSRSRVDVIQYTVDFGDSVFGIADKYNIEPETILWANYDLLNDNPDFLEPGMELNIPPIDGVYYKWQEGDTLDGVAREFLAEADDIVDFTGNNLDLMNPEIIAGMMVMIPDGQREFRQWLIPTIARGSAGVNTVALGPGACSGSYEGAYGSGAFIFPSDNHFLSGNDYWSGHLGIDLAAGFGANIYSADAGVVVFSGWANGGYGYTVMIDHGNGYQSLYAHMSQVSVPCGASVGAGRLLGLAGSTGNSTGAHLHFEVRLNGGFVNPWFVLPAP